MIFNLIKMFSNNPEKSKNVMTALMQMDKLDIEILKKAYDQ